MDHQAYRQRLARVKAEKGLDWSSIPTFAIFHEGAELKYLVLAWWGNENEMLTHVSVKEKNTDKNTWIHAPDTYSFCLWDLEILWAERNIFIDTLYNTAPSIDAYRQKRFMQN